jgi:hypothetical protein
MKKGQLTETSRISFLRGDALANTTRFLAHVWSAGMFSACGRTTDGLVGGDMVGVPIVVCIDVSKDVGKERRREMFEGGK